MSPRSWPWVVFKETNSKLSVEFTLKTLMTDRKGNCFYQIKRGSLVEISNSWSPGNDSPTDAIVPAISHQGITSFSAPLALVTSELILLNSRAEDILIDNSGFTVHFIREWYLFSDWIRILCLNFKLLEYLISIVSFLLSIIDVNSDEVAAALQTWTARNAVDQRA